jgi:hypothetical protein
MADPERLGERRGVSPPVLRTLERPEGVILARGAGKRSESRLPRVPLRCTRGYLTFGRKGSEPWVERSATR